MAEILIVPMGPEHLDAAALLEQLCFSHPWSKSALEETLKNPCAYFFAAEWEGKTAGYAGMHCACGECYIDNIAVFPEYRRKGVASALLRSLIDCAKSENSEFLSLEVRPSNHGAIALYESFGFRREGVRKRFYSSPTEDALIMTLAFANQNCSTDTAI